jgi:hypothetical protein
VHTKPVNFDHRTLARSSLCNSDAGSIQRHSCFPLKIFIREIQVEPPIKTGSAMAAIDS